MDQACTHLCDSNSKVTSDLTLYAKWSKNTPNPDDPQKPVLGPVDPENPQQASNPENPGQLGNPEQLSNPESPQQPENLSQPDHSKESADGGKTDTPTTGDATNIALYAGLAAIADITGLGAFITGKHKKAKKK